MDLKTFRKKLVADIAQYERDTGHKFRTALKQHGDQISDVVMPADFHMRLDDDSPRDAGQPA